MRFVVRDRSGAPDQGPFPQVVLRRDNWDDFGYKTFFEAIYYAAPGDRVDLGGVKILQRGQESGYTPLEETFPALGASYCSLGQDPDYYTAISKLPQPQRRSYLRAVRDAAYSPEIEGEFVEEEGWETSLLRFGQARNALDVGRALLTGSGTQKRTGVLSFDFHASPGGHALTVPFVFDDAAELPGRCNVLIGYNGVGKTRLLAELAVAASKYGAKRGQKPTAKLTGEDTNFGAVVAVSYSAFDTFETPPPRRDQTAGAEDGRTEVFGYVYCGLRRVAAAGSATTQEPGNSSRGPEQLKTIQEIEAEFATALREAGRRDQHQHLLSALDRLAQEPSFGRIGVDLAQLAQGAGSQSVLDDFRRLSTGHKIVMNIVTQMAAHLRPRSLVLIDEPETHLHPPLMAALLKAIQSLLEVYDSFAVIATHSPVVVQEVPARYVKVLERIGDRTSVVAPEAETFGENVGTITRQVFSLDSSATDYQGVLARLAATMSLDEIEALFERGLSTQARALVLNYRNGRAW